jgi:predicted ATPase/class 3 adenylate cyclase
MTVPPTLVRIMSGLPTGIVTFLFTDIEGSTRLVDRLGSAWGPVLELHDAILREAITAHAGVVVSTAGDSIFAAFAEPERALAAATAAQRGLAAAPWPEGCPVRVRMGLHTAAAEVAGANYAGLEVHRASRIADAAHGGQLIISDTTRALVAPALPPGISICELGAHRLKDLPQPERLFQVCVDGVPGEFPPPRTLGRRLIVLPGRTTSFIGRVADIGRIGALLEQASVVTLTGPGGTGKTSVAVEVAARLGSAYADGAVFVGLAALRDPSLVAPAIARTLELPEEPGRSPEQVVLDRLADAQLLLVLDNLEQLPDAGLLIARITAAGSGVRVLATSRAPLGIGGEAEYRLGPLGLPPVAGGGDPLARAASDAVDLFVDRARRVDPEFTLAADNIDAVVDICATLDGLPLAIELAAARLRVLTPQAIRLRLDQRLRLLTGGARDAPERQQTLRATIDWSHELLDLPAQTLFRRQAVFRGGWTLDAAEAVADVRDALDGLETLVTQSLVVRDDPDGAEPRFRMLETIREYALDVLDASGELVALRDAHLAWCRELAEREGAAFDREHDNLRAALGWSLETDRESGLRIATHLARFWLAHDHVREGESWFVRLLGAGGGAPATRARALAELAGLRYWQERYREAESDYQAALEAYRVVGDAVGADDVLYSLGWVAAANADWPAAQVAFAGVLGECRRRGDRGRTGLALQALGMALHRGGDQPAARATLEEAVAVLVEVGDTYGLANARYDLGRTLRAHGEPDAARVQLLEALRLHAESGHVPSTVFVFEALSRLEVEAGRPQRAVALAAGADTLRATLSAHPPEAIVERWDVDAAIGATLTRDVRDAAWVEGAALTFPELLELAEECGDVE